MLWVPRERDAAWFRMEVADGEKDGEEYQIRVVVVRSVLLPKLCCPCRPDDE
jgi:hypothetical protein